MKINVRYFRQDPDSGWYMPLCPQCGCLLRGVDRPYAVCPNDGQMWRIDAAPFIVGELGGEEAPAEGTAS